MAFPPPSRWSRLLSLLTMMLAPIALTACNSSQQSDGGTLRVGSQRGGTKALMIASGALDGVRFTVEWSEFPAAQSLLEAIGSGAVDLGLAGDAPFIFAYQSGSHIKAVAGQYVEQKPAGALALIVPGQSPAHSLNDLRGKRIATTRGSIGHYLVIRALAQAKLPSDWVNLIFLTPGDAKAAFSSGAIDGWAIWTPYLPTALHEGARTIVDGKTLVSGFAFDVASEPALANKRKLLADFLRREATALRWARDNPDAYAAVLARETGLPLPVARDFAIKTARTSIPITAAVIAEQKQVLDDFRKAGESPGTRDLAGAFDTSF
jgi:sulfonate transport system substrate-binding protein